MRFPKVYDVTPFLYESAMQEIFKLHPSRHKTQAYERAISQLQINMNEWEGLCFYEMFELSGTKSRPKIPRNKKNKK